MKKLDLKEMGIDADPDLRSPCLGCPKLEDTKKSTVCEYCPDRIEYAKSISGPTTVEDLIEMSGKDLPPDQIKRPRFCTEEGCYEIHYAKDKCRKHYYQDYHRKRKAAGKIATTTTIVFTTLDGGPEILALIKKIARHEDRSLNMQCIRFLAEGVLNWLEENGE